MMKKWIAGIAGVAILFGCVGCGAQETRPVDSPVTNTVTASQTAGTTSATSQTSAVITQTTTTDTATTTSDTTAGTGSQIEETQGTRPPIRPTAVNNGFRLPPLVAGTGAAYKMVKNPIKAQISARNAIVYDETHGLVLYGKNIDAACAPASITKVLTAIVACQKVPLDTVFTVGSEIDLVAGAASRAFITKGSRYTLSTLLEALLIPSGCDAAYTIAVNVARRASGNKALTDRQALNLFVRYMNQAAHDMGATHSQFRCVDGFPTTGHYTTARDLLTIARTARSFPALKTIMARSVSSNGCWFGTNALIKSYSSYYYTGANGMKTGTSDEAGNCVMASASKKGVSLIVIVMGSAYRYEDAVTLLDKGFAMASKITTTKKTTQKTTKTTKKTTVTTKKPTTASVPSKTVTTSTKTTTTTSSTATTTSSTSEEETVPTGENGQE